MGTLLVRVFLRNRTNRMCVYVCVCMCVRIHTHIKAFSIKIGPHDYRDWQV